MKINSNGFLRHFVRLAGLSWQHELAHHKHAESLVRAGLANPSKHVEDSLGEPWVPPME